MSEFKGTKGKWNYEVKYGKNKDRITVQIPKTENYNQELILGFISDDDCDVASCCRVEEHANAKLIACAPEMLEMLDKARSIISRLKGSIMSHPDCTQDSEFADYVDLAEFNEDSIKSLIKKATE